MQLIRQTHIYGGIQKLYYAPNGYGASVVKHAASYGYNDDLWELAVIKWLTDPIKNDKAKFHLVYNTPITDNVIGNLNNKEITAILKQIEELPS